jgi:HD-GYP domain-containing protein (c-di-GMP phosphodiesterase class II)
MATATTTVSSLTTVVGDDAAHVIEELVRFFAVRFACWDGETGGRISSGDQPLPRDALRVEERVRAVARGSRIEVLAETGGALLLALPLPPTGEKRVVTAAFLLDGTPGSQGRIADLLDAEPADLTAWQAVQPVWQRDQLLNLAEAVHETLISRHHARRMEQEVSLISQNLATTYEEISLLYTITQNLRISRPDEEIGRLALDRLTECIPAEGFAIEYLPWGDEGSSRYPQRREATLICTGTFPLDRSLFDQLTAKLRLDEQVRTCVINRRFTSRPDWEFPQIRQLIVAPLAEGDKLFGWLAAANHQEDAEFGTVEANLLTSLGTLLGIHGSNRQLYREQAEFVESVVRALASAIDAKDPYTSGHSDRVARFAVRLSLEMRCEPKFTNTIYMAGLLHDVGKIGIDDSVLRKPGRLTDAEFEHIKLHPELGYRILADLKQLSDVLPAVLHHHERWDGQGYPHGLSAENIPTMARIMAVADAYDAMTSDRPYRAGMSEEKVDAIFREGSGSHWDPAVVRAYFRAKQDILEIAHRERSDQQRRRTAESPVGDRDAPSQ